MSLEVEQFISKFHNLPGNTIGEKKKSLFLLLQNIPADGDALIATLTPKTYLEQLFSLEVYLKLQRVPQLIAVLKSGEEHLVAKLLENKWFCQRLAKTLDENSAGFVDEVLPCMSYLTKLRLLKKLAMYGTTLDNMFEQVYTRYGNHIASNLLLGCTETKIKEMLANDLTLSPFQQKLLFEKFPHLFILYVEQNKPYDESVVRYIAKKDIETFIKLTKFNLRGTLGKRLTRKLLVNFKNLVLTKAVDFSCILHPQTIIRELEGDFKQFYFDCFPSSADPFNPCTGFYNLSNKLGKRKHYKYLFEGFRLKYNRSLYEYPNLVSEEMMEAMDLEDRDKWIAIKKKHGFSDDLIKYMKISRSIPIIKKKMNVTSSVNSRERLMDSLLMTCKINKDLDALAEVGEYVCTRHRNDDISVLTEYLWKLQNYFDLSKFRGKHWYSTKRLLKIIELKTSGSSYTMGFYSAYLEFRFNKNKWKEDDVFDFLKNVKDNGSSYTIKNEDLKKIILVKSIDFAPKLLGKDEKLKYCDLQSINAIIEWNQQHPSDQLSIGDYQRLIQSLRECIDDAIKLDEYISELYAIQTIFKHIICHGEFPDLKDEVIKAYFLVGFRFYDVEIDFWLLKFHPEIISVNFDKFLDHIIYSCHPDLKILDLIKKYSFQKKTVTYCLEKFEQNHTSNKILIILAVLMTAEEFLQWVAPHYPVEDKIDENNEDKVKKGRISAEVAASFKYTTNPIILPTLLGYCKGDFLRNCLESMYYLFYHFPENKLSAFISDLSTKAVSARKHAIFLTCIVGSVDDVKTLFTRFIQSERNVSVQKHLFTAALKYFIKNPSDEFWETLKLCMANLDKNDKKSFAMLVNLEKIPLKYRARHLIFVWEILKKPGDFYDNRRKLLSSIPSDVFVDLPLQFLQEVIADNFLNKKTGCFEETNHFVVSALTKTSHRVEIMDKIFEIIPKLKIGNSHSLTEKIEAYDTINCFINTIVEGLQQDVDYTDVLRQFSQRWHSLFTVTYAMVEHLQISFPILYLESNKDILAFNAAIEGFFKGFVSIYGTEIIDTFASVLRESLKSLLMMYGDCKEDYFRFCLPFLKHTDLTFYLLVLKLLPYKAPHESGAKGVFLEIIKRLRQAPQESIQALLNIYLKNMQL